MQLEVNEDEMYNKPNTKREEKIKVQDETRKKMGKKRFLYTKSIKYELWHDICCFSDNRKNKITIDKDLKKDSTKDDINYDEDYANTTASDTDLCFHSLFI